MRATGLPVELDLPPSTVEISAEEDHAAYRIVQEALTNVLRHAGPEASAVVSVRMRGPRLLVTVRDDGRTVAAAEPGVGQGIAGMRRRAESVGGTLAAGPAAGGGFIVEATRPLSTPERPASTPERPVSTPERGV
jgi:signal transduction histidine kinase